jgi:hypothetical protein
MPDYGHALEFGAFLTPTNAPPEAPVDLAILVEELGYDLVAFQDHPYQPAFLDTWTLMSWVAARTDRIRITADVHNLPLRPPAVLARSAASLDLLSGGRIELGLGAGGFWDAVDAMGGRRLTPGQAVDALDEAVDVIRGIWNTSDRSPLRVHGEHYRLDGAKRGPAPVHDIPIWIGALKPRMLRLIGRKGDGWLPSLFYLQDGDLRRGNATIDAAASGAGRDPREIRRLLNVGGRFQSERSGPLQGPPEAWIDDLLPLVLEDGVGTLILASDDPDTLQLFSTAVMPQLRDRVAEERERRGTATGRIRSSAARAARREGIDYDAVPESLAPAAIEPGDAAYGRVRNTYMRGGSPGLVLPAATVGEVRDALAFARAQDVPLGIRSAGHGISGRSTNDGGVIIDVSRMRGMTVLDEPGRLVRLEPGARWLDVARFLQPHGWALTSGDYGGVGVGGIGVAGGIGWFAREHGLTIDHLHAVELVTVRGELLRASATENPELFWGMRGAGSLFGVATAFEFEVDEVGEVGFARLAFDATDLPGFLEGYGRIVEASPRDLTASLVLGPPQAGQPVIAQLLAVVDSAEPDTILSRLQPFADLAPLVGQAVQVMPYADVMGTFYTEGPQQGHGEPASRSGLVEHISRGFAEEIERMLLSGATHFLQFRSVGGAVSDVPEAATAYAGRSASFSVAAISGSARRIDPAWDLVRPHLVGGYVSFETDRDERAMSLIRPPEVRARLRAIGESLGGMLDDNLGV